MRRAARPVGAPSATGAAAWGTMDDVAHGSGRRASLAARRRGPALGGLAGRSWVLWAGAAATAAVGVAGALSFGAAPGRVDVPAGVVLPATARTLPARDTVAPARGLEIVPAVRPVVVEPPESGGTEDHREASTGTAPGGEGAGSSAAVPETADVTTSPTTGTSNDATPPGPAAPGDGASAAGSADGGSTGTTAGDASSGGSASTVTSPPASEGDS